MTIVRTLFRGMNTEVAFLSSAGGHAHERTAEKVQNVFTMIEQRLSRFRPDSELSQLNRSAGQRFRASPLLFQVVSLALEAAAETGGLFEPAVLPALEAAGYDRSFELVGAEPSRTASTRWPECGLDFRSIACDRDTSTIQLAVGQQLDLGGIGKGFAVDQALAVTQDLPDCCINAGGDLRVRGAPDGSSGWTVALEDTGDLPPMSVQLTDAALATSSTVRRRWVADNEMRHHLIDPRTNRPSHSPLRSVSVVAATCVRADVAAKTALLMGADGLAFLEERGMHGYAVGVDGRTATTSRWPTA